MDEANAVLMGGGIPAIKFGDTPPEGWHSGTIVSYERRQQTDFKTREPLTWRDGSPMWQVVVTLQTEERDPTIDNDDGLRKLYIRTGLQKKAISEAVRAAGQTGLSVGSMLGIRFSGWGESDAPNPPKEYEARYKYQEQVMPVEVDHDDPGEQYDPETEPF